MPDTPIALSLVIPFFDEAGFVVPVAEAHRSALGASGIEWEMILVDNGSRDATGSLCDEQQAACPRTRALHIHGNRGYGYGVRCGLGIARGEFLAYTDGDNQIPAQSVADLYRLARARGVHLAKAVRRTRRDPLERRIVSVLYNAVFRAVTGTPIADVNAKPKVFSRDLWDLLDLRSDDWFIDAEIMLRARDLPRAELPIVFEERSGGTSHVRASTLREFARNLRRVRSFPIPAIRIR